VRGYRSLLTEDIAVLNHNTITICREECITEYIPDNQWSYMQKHSQHPEEDKVLVDLGFLVGF
jgi:hypothetical protein